MARRRRRKLKTWIYFPLLIIVVAIATLLFVILGRGGLPEEATSLTPTPDSTAPTPPPTPTAKPPASRLFPYFNSNSAGTGGTWGFKDDNGDVAIDAIYENVQPFSEGMAFVAVKQDGGIRYQVIGENGEVLAQPSYEDAHPFKEGFAAVKQGSHWGFVNASFALTFNYEYDAVGDFSSGLARVQKEGKWGYISADAPNNPAIPLNFDFAEDFSGTVATVGTKDADGSMSYHFIDTSGVVTKGIGKAEAGVFSQGLVAVKKADNQYVYYNMMGQQQFGDAAVFEDAKAFTEERAAVKKNGKWGFIDKDGAQTVECVYEAAEPYADGLAAVKQNGKWGYIDLSGQPVTEFAFDSAESFANGFALVSVGQEVSSIDAQGKLQSLYILPANVSTQKQTGVIKVTSGNANVRKTPSTDGEIVMGIANGRTVDIVGKEGDWYKVSIAGVEGYVRQDFITVTP